MELKYKIALGVLTFIFIMFLINRYLMKKEKKRTIYGLYLNKNTNISEQLIKEINKVVDVLVDSEVVKAMQHKYPWNPNRWQVELAKEVSREVSTKVYAFDVTNKIIKKAIENFKEYGKRVIQINVLLDVIFSDKLCWVGSIDEYERFTQKDLEFINKYKFIFDMENGDEKNSSK